MKIENPIKKPLVTISGLLENVCIPSFSRGALHVVAKGAAPMVIRLASLTSLLSIMLVKGFVYR